MAGKAKKRDNFSYNPNRFNALDGGICYLVILTVFFCLPYVVKYTCRDLLLSAYNYDTYLYLLLNLLISQSAIFLVALIFSAARKVNPFKGGGYEAKKDGVQILMSVMLIMGVMLTFYYVHMQFSDDAEFIFGSSSGIEQHLSPLAGLYMIIYVIAISVLPAICEEMLFRGVVMRGLEQFGGITAVIVSSLAFSLMHGNFSQLLLQFIGGVAIASAVSVTRNYLVGSVMHFTNNLFAVIYGILIYADGSAGILFATVNKAVDGMLILIGVSFLVVSIVYFMKLAFDNQKKSISGEEKVNKYEKREFYRVKENGREYLLDCQVKAEMKPRSENGEKLFYIGGKYRKLNAKSPFAISVVVFSAAFLFAIIQLFL